MLCFCFPVFADSTKFERRGTLLIYNSNISDDEDESRITNADVAIFRKFIEDKRPWKKIWTIRLTSQGGSGDAARDIADIITKHRIDTQVDAMCASACTEIFMGGEKRRLMKGGELLFHQHYVPKNDTYDHRRELKVVFPDLEYIEAVAHYERLTAAYNMSRYEERGIELRFSLRLLQIHPNKEWIPTRYELEEYGVIN